MGNIEIIDVDTMMSEFESMANPVLERMTPYILRSRDVATITEFDAPVFLKQMVDGILEVGSLLARVAFQMVQAETEVKRTDGLLRLEEFPAFAADRKLKGTVSEMDAFVNSHNRTIYAKTKVAQWASIHTELLTFKTALVYSHDDAKKSVYSSKDYDRARGGVLA